MYLNNISKIGFIQTANCMNKQINLKKFKNKFTDEQKQNIKNENKVQDFYNCKKQLHDEI